MQGSAYCGWPVIVDKVTLAGRSQTLVGDKPYFTQNPSMSAMADSDSYGFAAWGLSPLHHSRLRSS